MKDHELTLEQSLASNALTAKLIETAADDFDLAIAESVHSLVDQVSRHRNISIKVPKKKVAELLGQVVVDKLA